MDIPTTTEADYLKESANKRKLIAELREKVNQHALEEEFFVSDNEKIIKQTRLMHLLDKLFEKGMEGSVPAISEYLDRVLGKPKQEIDALVTTQTSLLDLARQAQLERGKLSNAIEVNAIEVTDFKINSPVDNSKKD